ncbi:MAG: hypothetical protein K2P81_03920 [Bacteriovoracaceae bacterium]|nr:hypothetical protein [Bacteriovoracaceae bacterium]
MKAFALSFIILSTPLTSYAKCVVEIMNSSGDPLGYIFQDKTCPNPMAKCKAKLATLNDSSAKCEITLDIPGNKVTLTSIPLP